MPAQNRTLRWLIRGGFVLTLALTAFFAVRTVVLAIYWTGPEHRDQPLEGWMPLGYVARSWDVPRDVLREAAGLEEGTQPRRNLDMIARDGGISTDALIARLMAAIAAHREALHE
ncbi:MAG: hypothetical protein Kow0013_22590 [Pararhodobacter sp.]